MTVTAHVVYGPAGTITVSPAALTQIVVHAAEGIPGARVRRPRRGLVVEIAGNRARVACDLAARYGAVLPELAREVQQRVAGALETMCEVEVEAVDVSIEELDD